MREGEREREGREGGREGERGRERGERWREGERGERRKDRVSVRERGEGGKERERGERESLETYTHAHASAFTHQADMHTHCVPIIMYCIPTLREISVTTRADKVFLMPAQVLGSDTWLQRERETERVGTNRNIHTVSMNWNNNFM